MIQRSLPPLKISLNIKKPFSFLMKQFILIPKARLFTCKNPMSKKTDTQPPSFQRLTSFNSPTNTSSIEVFYVLIFCISQASFHIYCIFIFSHEHTTSFPSCGKTKAMPQALWVWFFFFFFFLNAFLLIIQAESKAGETIL